VSTPFNRLNEAGNELHPQTVTPSGIWRPRLRPIQTESSTPCSLLALSLDKPAKIPSPDTFSCAVGNPATYRAPRLRLASFAQDEKGRGYFSKP